MWRIWRAITLLTLQRRQAVSVTVVTLHQSFPAIDNASLNKGRKSVKKWTQKTTKSFPSYKNTKTKRVKVGLWLKSNEHKLWKSVPEKVFLVLYVKSLQWEESRLFSKSLFISAVMRGPHLDFDSARSGENLVDVESFMQAVKKNHVLSLWLIIDSQNGTNDF